MSLYTAKTIRFGLRDFLVGRIIAALLSLVANLMIVRTMAADPYADYITLSGLQLLLLLLVSFGIERIMSCFVGEGVARWPRNEVTWMIGCGLVIRIVSIVALAILFMPLTDWLAHTLNIEDWREVAPAFWVYTFFFGLFEILQAAAQGLMLQRAIALSLVIQWGVRVVVLVAFLGIERGLNLIEVLWIFAVTSLVPCLILLPRIWIAVRYESSSSIYNIEKMKKRAVVELAWHNYLEKLTSIPTSMSFMRLIAAHSLPSYATASYGFYQTLTSMFYRHMPTTLTMGILEATVAGRYAERKSQKEAGTVLSAIFKINLLILTPLIAWLGISGGDVIALLTGGKYTNQSWALALITASLIPIGLWQLLVIYANTLSLSNVLSRAGIWSAICVLPLTVTILYVEEYSFVLLSTAGLVLGFLQVAIAIRMLNKRGVRLQIDALGAMRILLAAVAAAVITFLFNNLQMIDTQLLRPLITGFIVALFFFGFVYIFKIFRYEEYLLIQKIIPNYANYIRWLVII